MDIWLALLLGMVQGLTEFFPVSSSGHLMLLEKIFDIDGVNDYLLFNVICHLGTLLSILTIFRTELKEMIFENRSMAFKICLATLPLFPCALFLKEIRWLFSKPEYLGYFFLCTAVILFQINRKNKNVAISKRGSLVVGLSQAIALFPGVSRSGTTIACGKLLGWSDESAIRFSFLLAIPAILGATVLESLKWVKEGNSTIDALPALLGFLSSYFFGLLALKTLKQLVSRAKLGYFAWYCLGIAALSFWLFR